MKKIDEREIQVAVVSFAAGAGFGLVLSRLLGPVKPYPFTTNSHIKITASSIHIRSDSDWSPDLKTFSTNVNAVYFTITGLDIDLIDQTLPHSWNFEFTIDNGDWFTVSSIGDGRVTVQVQNGSFDPASDSPNWRGKDYHDPHHSVTSICVTGKPQNVKRGWEFHLTTFKLKSAK